MSARSSRKPHKSRQAPQEPSFSHNAAGQTRRDREAPRRWAMEPDPIFPLPRSLMAGPAVDELAPPVPDRPPGTGRHAVIAPGRDMANPLAGGSELLIDQLASGLVARGDRVTLL